MNKEFKDKKCQLELTNEEIVDIIFFLGEARELLSQHKEACEKLLCEKDGAGNLLYPEAEDNRAFYQAEIEKAEAIKEKLRRCR